MSQMHEKHAKEFAERLHNEFCKLSHIDYCSWDYEYGMETKWTQKHGAHQSWLDKSYKTLSVFAGYTDDQIINLIRFVKETI